MKYFNRYLQIISLQSQLLTHKIQLLKSKHPTVNRLHSSHGPGSGLGLMLQAGTQMQGLRDIQHCSLEVIHLCPQGLYTTPRPQHAATCMPKLTMLPPRWDRNQFPFYIGSWLLKLVPKTALFSLPKYY